MPYLGVRSRFAMVFKAPQVRLVRSARHHGSWKEQVADAAQLVCASKLKIPRPPQVENSMIVLPATKAQCVAENSLKSGILRHGRQRPSVCAVHPPQHPAAVPRLLDPRRRRVDVLKWCRICVAVDIRSWHDCARRSRMVRRRCLPGELHAKRLCCTPIPLGPVDTGGFCKASRSHRIGNTAHPQRQWPFRYGIRKFFQRAKRAVDRSVFPQRRFHLAPPDQSLERQPDHRGGIKGPLT